MELLQSLSHPEEVKALMKWKLWGSQTLKSKCVFNGMSRSLKTCYDLLNKTSRSYGTVIQTLDGAIRNEICIFYLVLRALDTVEDDMTIPIDVKIPILKSFYKNLYDPQWKYTQSKDKDKIVLEQFPAISKEFRKLDKILQEVISDVTQKMGEGMSEFLLKTMDTLEDWDKYCHYVAGLVGVGLVRIFSESKLEGPNVGHSTQLANEFGVVAQKTNHIKDFLEDWKDKRIFWPKAIWSKYVEEVGDITKIENQAEAVQCLNELITTILEKIPLSLKFLGMLRNQSIFTFVALPQIVAIANLERCYNNSKVFCGHVKIRKGEAVRIMMESNSLDKVKAIVRHYVQGIISKIPSNDPNSGRTSAICLKVLELTYTHQQHTASKIYPALCVSLGLILTAISYTYWS